MFRKKIVSLFILFFSLSFVFAVESEPVEKADLNEDEAVIEKISEAVDSKNLLRNLTLDGEIFIPETRDSETVLIHSTEKETSRTFYDSLNRVVRKEIWKITSAKDSKRIRIEYYEYNGNSNLLKGKTIITEDSEENFIYSNAGFLVLNELFNFVETSGSEKNAKEKLQYAVSKKAWKYDSENRVVSETQVNYVYKNNDYKKAAEKKSSRKKYFYHEDSEIPPDTETYENGIIQKRVLYETAGDYTAEIFFDHGYVVKSYYENNQRRKDEFFQDGSFVRSKEY